MNEAQSRAMAQTDLQAVYGALNRIQAMIEFDLEGNVLAANDNFLNLFGYERNEVIGHHHRMFCEPDYAASDAYAAFWTNLAAGKCTAAEFKRLGKDGGEIWLQASYNPVIDEDGRPVRVLKFATDIERTSLRNAKNDVL